MLTFKWDFLFRNYRIILLLYLLLAIVAGLQSVMLGRLPENADQPPHIKYNNYMIFKQSFAHLTEAKDLYQAYPEEYKDLYKYSPSFALFFGFFYMLPDALGLILWNICNALILFFAFVFLPQLDIKRKILMLMVIAVELMTSLQNSQANGLMAGLIILTFGLLEKRHYCMACFCLMCMFYIKLFGVLVLLMFLFYPKKWKLILYSLIWFLLFLAAPLLLISLKELSFHYIRWFELLQSDFTASYGLSVAGWLHAWFGFHADKVMTLLSGMILLMIPYLRIKQYQHFYFRLMALASLLIWVVIFNHKAESPTFIIAMSGISLWGLSAEIKPWKTALLVFALVLTSFSPTDLFPVGFREGFLIPYMVKVFPCIVIWTVILVEMISGKYHLPTDPDLHTQRFKLSGK